MSLPSLSFINVLLAAAPILLVLYLMAGRRWGGSEAGLAGWLVAALIAVIFFGANAVLLLVAAGRAMLLALFVLYIIWMALLLYHVVNEAGAIKVIGERLPDLAPDRAGQALLLAWAFGSFLQGASGYGVPAAVVAPLLLGLGFGPNIAVAAALLGHGWAVTFGSLGASFISLIAATGVPGDQFASESALLLWVACLGCGLAVLWAAGGGSAFRARWPLLVLLTLVMGGVQWLLAVAGFWTLAALGAGLAGLFVGVLVLRTGILDFTLPAVERANSNHGNTLFQPRVLRALFPYLLLVVIIIVGQTVLKEPLGFLELNLQFPEVQTSFGWVTPEGPGRSIDLFGHAGALLLYGSVLGFLWFKWRGHLQTSTPYRARTIVRKTVKGSVKSTVSILVLVAMAVTMEHAGMTQLLAEALSRTGSLFPFLSPFVGALGAFMTGSNTNSNVVFGQLQLQTATALDLSVAVILAAQTAGGAIGSTFAPAKVVVGCSTVAGAQDGVVLRLATALGLSIVAILGIIALLFA
jgi:lactate permease